MTYSIVARDPDTGELGVAVQSHWFSVGSIVTWARPGVGAVATQANAESAEFANGFTYGGRDFAAYPLTVYSGLFRRLFGYGLGFAFVSYYPALALLGRADPLHGPDWLGWCAPLVAIAAALAAGGVWRLGVRHYRSTGS